MARAYPRFLFAESKNTKSEGPFVIHCLEPRLIFKVKNDGLAYPKLVLLDEASSPELEQQYADIYHEAQIWIIYQVKNRSIVL